MCVHVCVHVCRPVCAHACKEEEEEEDLCKAENRKPYFGVSRCSLTTECVLLLMCSLTESLTSESLGVLLRQNVFSY